MPLDIRVDSALTDLGESVVKSNRSGFGGTGDPGNTLVPGWGMVLGEHGLRQLYRHSILGRVVDIWAEDSTAGTPILDLRGNGTPEDAAIALKKYLRFSVDQESEEEQGADTAFCEAQRWANLFGSAYIVAVFNGGDDNPFLPMRLQDIQSIDDLIVLDCWQMRPHGKGYERFTHYEVLDRISESTGDRYGTGKLIHKSRVLEFFGSKLPRYDYRDNNYKHDSILQRIWDDFASSQEVKGNVQAGLRSFSVFMLGIEKLSEILLAPNGAATINNHLQSVIQNLRVHGVFLSDSALEKGEFKGRAFAGVKENWEMFIDDFTAATGLPYYKLWGRVGRAGLSDDGGAEQKQWEEKVAAYRKHHLYSNHRRLFKWIFQSTLGGVPEDWDLSYPSLYQSNPKEDAEVQYLNSQAYEKLTAIAAVDGRDIRELLSTGATLETVLQQRPILEQEEPEDPPEAEDPEDDVEDPEDPTRTDAEPMRVSGPVLTAAEWAIAARITEEDLQKALEGSHAGS